MIDPRQQERLRLLTAGGAASSQADGQDGIATATLAAAAADAEAHALVPANRSNMKLGVDGGIMFGSAREDGVAALGEGGGAASNRPLRRGPAPIHGTGGSAAGEK